MPNNFEEFLKLYWEQLPPAEMDFYSKNFPIFAGHNGYEKHFEVLNDEMRIAPDERILEVGIGTFIGGFSKYSSSAGLFIGVDIDKKTIGRLKEWAKKNKRAEQFFVMDGTKLAFKGGYFDRVLFHNFYGEEAIAAIVEAKRVLKKGGKIYMGFALPKEEYVRSNCNSRAFLSDIPKFWNKQGFKTAIVFWNTAKMRDGAGYYLTAAEKL